MSEENFEQSAESVEAPQNDITSNETQPETGTEESNNDTSNIEVSETEGTHVEEDKTNNAEHAKKRIEKKYRRQEREIAELNARVSRYEETLRSMQPQAYAQAPAQPHQDYGQPQQLVHPVTGEYLTPGTEMYNVVLYDKQKEAFARQQSEYMRQQQTAEWQKELDNEFFNSLDDAADKYEDFDDVVRNDSLPLTEAMVNVAKIIPDGADFLYYLAKNPKEVSRISKLDPLKQQRAVAKHAYDFAAKNKITSAPAPVQPVGSTSGVSNTNSYSKLARDPTAFRKFLRDKQKRKR